MRNRCLAPIFTVFAAFAVFAALAVSCGSATAQVSPNGIMQLPIGVMKSPNGATRGVVGVTGGRRPTLTNVAPTSGVGGIEVSLGVQTYLISWAEYDTVTCEEISSGSWAINSSPAHGAVSFGTVTAPGPCGDPFTFAAIYYTLTDATATSDTFSATWNGPDFTEPGTFNLVAFDLAKNDGDCDCHCEGNPINAATGNKCQTETDFVGARNTGLELRRYYNSRATPGGGTFGTNWGHTFARSIVPPSGSVTSAQAVHADGSADTYASNAGAYVGSPDVMDRLNRVPASGTQTGWQLVKADDSVEAYTLAGLLTSITTRAGLVTNLTYDGSHHLTTVTGPFGHTLTFAYDGSGRVVQMTVPDGTVYAYAYSGSGNLATVTYPGGVQRQYVYENANYPNALTGIIDENGQRFATYTYDLSGRAVVSQHAGGAEQTTVIDNGNGVTSVTDARGNVHGYVFTILYGLLKQTSITGVPVQTSGGDAFTYDANGFMASRTDWNGNVTTYTHDTRGNETQRVMASGSAVARTINTTWHATFHLPTQIVDGTRTFSFTYDAKGNLLSRTVTAPGLTSTWNYTYNSSGLVLTATDPNGKATTYTYDAKGDVATIANALGQVTSFSSYDPNGRPLTIQDPNGLVTTFTYNFRGQVTSKTEAQWVTTATYDAVGQLTKFTRLDGYFLNYSYDVALRLAGFTDPLGIATSYTLDATSNRIGEQVLSPGGLVTIGGQKFGVMGTMIRSRTYAYDAVNRLSQTVGAQGQTTNYTYDTNSNLTQITDPLGHTTSFSYDALNRVVGVTDPNGGLTDYTYDALGRLATVVDPRNLQTSFAYDGLDDSTSITSPDSGVTTKTYDAAGNVLTSKDARNNTTTYTHDAINRVTKATFQDATSITYQYDQGTNGKGHLTSMTDAGGTTTWAYDVHGRVTSKVQTIGTAILTTTRSYSATTGQLTSMTYPSGAVLGYSYDANGRVSGITYQPSGGSQSSLLSAIAYQPFGGPVASWTMGNGGSYSRAFDQDGHITGLRLPASNTPAARIGRAPFGASPVGRPSEGSAPVSGSVALAYDAASRITSIVETGLATKTFGYDALDRVTSYSGTNTQTYAYDANGNRTTYTATTPSTTLNYTYASTSNRLNLISGSSTESFTYDASGNMLSHTTPGAGYTYAYNTRGRRTQASVGAIATNDTINGLDQRTVQTQGSSELFVYDEADHLIGTYNVSGVVSQEMVWLDNLPVAVLASGGPYYIAPDHLGAPHQITDPAVNAVWLGDHDTFGNGAPQGSTFTFNLRFPGQFYDANAKLNYNRFRDYDPNTGRYIESDPIGLRGGINPFAYAQANPVSLIDRSGLLTLNGGVNDNNYIDQNGQVQPLNNTAPPGYSNDPGQGFVGSRPRNPNDSKEQGACYNYAPPFDPKTKFYPPFHFAHDEGTTFNGAPVYSWVNGDPSTKGGTGNDVIYSSEQYMKNIGVIGK